MVRQPVRDSGASLPQDNTTGYEPEIFTPVLSSPGTGAVVTSSPAGGGFVPTGNFCDYVPPPDPTPEPIPTPEPTPTPEPPSTADLTDPHKTYKYNVPYDGKDHTVWFSKQWVFGQASDFGHMIGKWTFVRLGVYRNKKYEFRP